MEKVRVLFVCLGNICRSPLAEGVFRHLAAEAGLDGRVEIDSAGTTGFHAGEPPDGRMTAVAKRHGVDLSGQRARQFEDGDFERFDVVLAMDGENERVLRRRCPPEHAGKVKLLRSYDPDGPGDVPDPYYGGASGFDRVHAIVSRSCAALLDAIRSGS